MSSPCLSGGGRAYGFDLEMIKSPSASSSSWASHSTSPSSTLSESSNSPRTISTKKTRTPRKRPNQTYTEAAAMLAKIYPNIFSTKNLKKQSKFAKHRDYFVESSDLLLPFPSLADADFLLRGPVVEPCTSINSMLELKTVNSFAKWCWSPTGFDFKEPCSSPCIDDDFEAESILDEEISEGIDSIMGNLVADVVGNGDDVEDPPNYTDQIDPYLGHHSGTMFGLSITSALRNAGSGEWWCSPTVEINNIVPKPKLQPQSPEKKKKKKKKVEKLELVMRAGESVPKCETDAPVSSTSCPKPKAASASCLKPALSLNLNFERVMQEWADGRSPFSESPDSSESPADIIAKLSDIDLLSETAGTSGIREASVLRYKEKRRSRLFSKKIRYQVRKVNADLRPRMKASGRFAKKDEE